MSGRLLVGVLVLVAAVGCTSAPRSSEPPAPSGAAAGPNGVERLPAAEIMRRSSAALARAGSVRVAGKVDVLAAVATFDLRVRAARGSAPAAAVGTIGYGGRMAGYRRLDKKVYVEGNTAFWDYPEALTAAQHAALAGRWVDCSACRTDSSNRITIDTEFWAQVSDFPTLADYFGPDAGDAFTVGERGTIGGVPAISVHTTNTRDLPGTVWVALRGQPYPLRATQTSGASTQLDLADFGAPVDVTPPPADKIVTPAQVEGPKPPPAPDNRPLTGTVTIPLHGTADLPRLVKITYLTAGDKLTVRISGDPFNGQACNGTGSFTLTTTSGVSTGACGMAIRLDAIDHNGPALRITYSPQK